MWEPAPVPGARTEIIAFRGVKKTRAEWRRELGLEVEACKCKRFQERARRGKVQALNFIAPPSAIVLKRPDLKRYKAMGWAIHTPTTVRCYLEQFRPKTVNQERAILGSLWRHEKKKQQGIVAGLENGHAAATHRAAAAIECCYVAADVLERGRPSRIVLVRVSTGKCDDDGLIGALKYIRDGVAEALLIDDREFTINGKEPDGIPTFYEKRNPGKRGAFGTMIEIYWKGAT